MEEKRFFEAWIINKNDQRHWVNWPIKTSWLKIQAKWPKLLGKITQVSSEKPDKELNQWPVLIISSMVQLCL